MATASVALPTNLSNRDDDGGLLTVFLVLLADRPTARPLAEVSLRLKEPACWSGAGHYRGQRVERRGKEGVYETANYFESEDE